MLLTLALCRLSAQNVTITGKTNKPNSMVRLLTYNDLLTFETSEAQRTKSDSNGCFTLQTTIDNVSLVQIAVDLERVEVLLSPNASYNLEITIPEQDEGASYFERKMPVLKVNSASDGGLYDKFSMSEQIVNDFIADNFNRIYRNRQISLIDSIDVMIKRYVGDINSDFINGYIQYKKASLTLAAKNDGGKYVKKEFFDGKEVLYGQPAYFDLFNEIFSDYISNDKYNPNELLENVALGYNGFSKYISSKDEFFRKNEQLSEIVAAWNLRRMYYEFPKNKKMIMNCLAQLEDGSRHIENKIIAHDICLQLKRLSYDSEAPAFSLKDKEGRTVSLSDYKDKTVVVQFVDKVSKMTDFQFDVLNDLHKQWRDEVEVITIATKEGFAAYCKLFSDKGFNWQLLNLGDNFLLLEQYQIKIFPDYVIVKKGSRIGMSPAPAPDQDLDYHVRRINK